MILKTTYPVIVDNKVIASSDAYEGGFLNVTGEDLLGIVENKAKTFLSHRKKQASNKTTENINDTSKTSPSVTSKIPTSIPSGYVLTDADRKNIQDSIDMIGEDGLIDQIMGFREDLKNGSPRLQTYSMQDIKDGLAAFEAYAKERGWTEDYMNKVYIAGKATRTADSALKQYQASAKAYHKIKNDRIAITTLSIISVVLAATTIYLLFNKKTTT